MLNNEWENFELNIFLEIIILVNRAIGKNAT